MSLAEVLPNLKTLNRADKVRAIQFLANEIAREEGIWFEENQQLEFFSLHDSFEAAEVLMKLLEEQKANV